MCVFFFWCVRVREKKKRVTGEDKWDSFVLSVQQLRRMHYTNHQLRWLSLTTSGIFKKLSKHTTIYILRIVLLFLFALLYLMLVLLQHLVMMSYKTMLSIFCLKGGEESDETRKNPVVQGENTNIRFTFQKTCSVKAALATSQCQDKNTKTACSTQLAPSQHQHQSIYVHLININS